MYRKEYKAKFLLTNLFVLVAIKTGYTLRKTDPKRPGKTAPKKHLHIFHLFATQSLGNACAHLL